MGAFFFFLFLKVRRRAEQHTVRFVLNRTRSLGVLTTIVYRTRAHVREATEKPLISFAADIFRLYNAVGPAYLYILMLYTRAAAVRQTVRRSFRPSVLCCCPFSLLRYLTAPPPRGHQYNDEKRFFLREKKTKNRSIKRFFNTLSTARGIYRPPLVRLPSRKPMPFFDKTIVHPRLSAFFFCTRKMHSISVRLQSLRVPGAVYRVLSGIRDEFIKWTTTTRFTRIYVGPTKQNELGVSV